MSLNLAPLVYRLAKGSAINATEHDQNLTRIRDFVNALAALLEVSLNADGTLKVGAVDDATKIADRIITNDKMWWLFNFYGKATGTNTYLVPVSTINTGWGWTDGFMFICRFANANTATPCTIDMSWDGGVTGTGAAKTLKKLGSTLDVEVGDINANQIYVCIYDADNDVVQIAASTTPPLSRFSQSNDLTFPASGASLTWSHGFGNVVVKNFKGYLKCAAADAGYLKDDMVPIDQAFHQAGDATTQSINLTMEPAAGVIRYSYYEFAPPTINTHLPNKSTGVPTVIATGNWRIVLQAYM